MLDKTMEIAVKLHRQMWSDMQCDLGDCPSFYDRVIYKYQWCDKHIGSNLIYNDCFLCEYVEEMFPDADCAKVCPIKWVGDHAPSKYGITASDLADQILHDENKKKIKALIEEIGVNDFYEMTREIWNDKHN